MGKHLILFFLASGEWRAAAERTEDAPLLALQRLPGSSRRGAMADPVAAVEKIVRIGLKIKEAVDTVRQNEKVCHEITKRVLRFSDILSQLQQTGMVDDNPAMSGALEDLEETLQEALQLVRACQERHVVRRFFAAGDLARQLRRVKDDILNKVMLASFAINAHATIVLLTFQARHSVALLQQPQDRSELIGERNNELAASEESYAASGGIRQFSLSELKTATNNFSENNHIGKGAFGTIYKGVLHDGNMVAIKRLSQSSNFSWERTYAILRLVMSHQHRNIVKILGYVTHEVQSFWVMEYMPKGSLDKIIHESRVDWSSLFQIIKGIAHALHYLHEHNIVHRDVKPSNILLDCDMNPKINDFETCKVLDDIAVDIAGTVGYLDPEYFYTTEKLSTKIDVYAFGITLIEIVSSMCRFKPPRGSHLDRWAWDAWRFGDLEYEFDPSLFVGSQLMEIERCTVIGLLCAQQSRADRPTMADVLQMLHSETELPTPKIPNYVDSDWVWPHSPAAWSDESISPR
ncbi:hypothetical protein ACP70R_008649 [Stipagrostis hirtigluma subsp. patula]